MKAKLEKLKQEIENILNEDSDVNEVDVIFRLSMATMDTGIDVVSREWANRIVFGGLDIDLLKALLDHGVDNWEGFDMAYESVYGRDNEN